MIRQLSDPFNKNEISQAIDMTKSSLEKNGSANTPNLDSSTHNKWGKNLLKSDFSSLMLASAEIPLDLVKTVRTDERNGNDFFRPWEKATMERRIVKETRKTEEAKPGIFFDCDNCDKKFTSKQYLRQHVEIHTNLNLCIIFDANGKEFARECLKRMHEQIYKRKTSKKPIICTECGKTFVTRTVLKRHRLIHTGVKPFSCGRCGRCFVRKDHLDRHRGIHKGKKPFHC